MMHRPSLRRFPLVWSGFALLAGSGTVSASSQVEGVHAAAATWAAVLTFGLFGAWPLDSLSAAEPLPPRVGVATAGVALAGCVWVLTLPQDQGLDGIHAAASSLAGRGGLSSADAANFSALAFSALPVGVALGLVNWRLCVREQRRRRPWRAIHLTVGGDRSGSPAETTTTRRGAP